jgi:hypothetical protein
MTLFEWVGAVAMIERMISSNSVHALDIDLAGENRSFIMSPEEFIRMRTSIGEGPSSPRFSEAQRVYSVAGFLESLGTLNVLNQGRGGNKVGYRWLGREAPKLRSFYASKRGEQTVVLPLTRIESKDNCLQFLDEARIMEWREAMQERFRNSPLFEFDEVWRVFCHELAVNIWEHAKTTGFLAGRVVSPLNNQARIRSWCQASYPQIVQQLFPQMEEGFLELCVSDAGQGFTNSLGASYRLKTDLPPDSRVLSEDILAFSFDEIGTCKDAQDCWATERHALGRILQLVAKYGGALTLRSSGAVITYVAQGGTFQRVSSHRGFQPQAASGYAPELSGSHFQLILPLIPIIKHSPRQERHSVLMSPLPTGYQSDVKHVHGHLVPLLEALGFRKPAIGIEQLREFRACCERLARKLLQERASNEPLVLDFSGVNWTAGQFETLLHLLQNVLQQRPVLLVEIDRRLATEVVELGSRTARTQLDPAIADSSPSMTGRAYAVLSERTFLESFRRIHVPLLGLDIHGNRYIFGLPDRAYEQVLQELIETPKTLEEVCRTRGTDERVIRAILNNVNPLFKVENGRWHCVWDKDVLAVEAARVMSKHFDEVAERCEAWRGRPRKEGSIQPEPADLDLDDRKEMYFNLPWQDEWVREFFECSRILSRERYADEAAQRLVYRLQQGLPLIGHELKDVRILACATAPSILLAFALYRCWPHHPRPSIADLGPYLMLNPGAKLPAIRTDGAIIVIQDVQDRGRISGRVVDLLQEQNKKVLCILSLVRLTKQTDETVDLFSAKAEVTPISDGWTDPTEKVKKHAMIRLSRPNACPRPEDVADDKLYWVEPRTLRPFRYSILRGSPRSANAGRRTRMLPFFEPTGHSLVCAGHYTYGEKHYKVTVDIQRSLEGAIGDEVAAWLADVCSGTSHTKKEWESMDGHRLRGDVTAVLMPLHSRIHYIWPRLSNMLAQRNRRQPMWLLDATLFLGHGPYYRLPRPFEDQIKLSLNELRRQGERRINGGPTIRVLILDGAIQSGRTANTILDSLTRALYNAYRPLLDSGYSMETLPRVIEWIRYFTIFNQMSTAQNNHWHRLQTIGGGFSIPFIFEEFAHVPGVPVFRKSDCPDCATITRFERLITAANHHGAYDASEWSRRRAIELQPIAVDSSGSHPQPRPQLQRRLDLLPKMRQVEAGTQTNRFRVLHVDVAIWRFHELMYYSRPVSDVLMSLVHDNAWPMKGEELLVEEYERFRWAVFEWCLLHWSRLVADSARVRFLSFVMREVKASTPLIEKVFEALAVHFRDPHVQRLIVSSLRWLTKLERKRGLGDFRERARRKQRKRLGNALTLLLLNIPRADLDKLEVTVGKAGTSRVRLLNVIGDLAAVGTGRDLTFAKNIFFTFTRPSRHADPRWALRTVAELLCRGRDPEKPAAGGHRLLPKLLLDVGKDPQNEEPRSLLLGSLSQFLGALDDITPFATELAIGTHDIKERGNQVLSWLRLDAIDPGAQVLPNGLPLLSDDLLPEGSFRQKFDKIFHPYVEELGPHFVRHLKDFDITTDMLEFSFAPATDVKRSRLLLHAQRLYNFLANWAIDPAMKCEPGHKSRIEVLRRPVAIGADRLLFRIFTNFADVTTTNELTIHGRNFEAESSMLTTFGAELSERWVDPEVIGSSNSEFTAAYDIIIPAGFL